MLTPAGMQLTQIAATELFDALEDGELHDKIQEVSNMESINEDVIAGVQAALRLMIEQSNAIALRTSTKVLIYDSAREADLDEFQTSDVIIDSNSQAFIYTPSEHSNYPFPIVGFKKLPDPQYRQKVGYKEMEFPIKVYRTTIQ